MKKISIKKNTTTTILIILFVSILSNWQLIELRHYPDTQSLGNQDFNRHIAHILNFRDAFLDGQILPRLQLPPLDAPSLPVFQYYGTLMGFVCLPFLLIKLNPLLSLALGLILVKFLGGCALYLAGRLYCSNKNICILATLSYLLSPYILSNVLGRIAFPEATAHAMLPILFYGLIRILIKNDFYGVLITSLSILLLALAHPIFLEYGIFFALIFMIISSAKKNALFWGLLAILIGILISSFQWFPALIEYKNFSAPSFQFDSSPFSNKIFTSPKGLYWLPDSLADRKITHEDRLFLTPGILTLPSIGIILTLKEKTRLSVGLLCVLVIALILSFAPFDIWAYLPKFFHALQFPYRILAFVALFSSLSFCLIPEKYSPINIYLSIIIVILLQSIPILSQSFIDKPLFNYSDKDYKDRFANRDYKFASIDPSPAEDNILEITGNWLYQTTENSLEVKTIKDYKIGDFEQPIISKNLLENFDSKSTNKLYTLIDIYNFNSFNNSLKDNNFIDFQSSIIEIIYSKGYIRIYKFSKMPPSIKDIYIELPISYSSFYLVKQNGLNLNKIPSIHGLILFKTSDFINPIKVIYKLPLFSLFLTTLGLILLIISYDILSFQSIISHFLINLISKLYTTK